MDPETRELIEKTYRISEENNRILRGMRNAQRLAVAIQIVYFIFFAGSGFLAYYFLRPYINQAQSVYSSFLGGPASATGTTTPGFWQGMMSSFGM